MLSNQSPAGSLGPSPTKSDCARLGGKPPGSTPPHMPRLTTPFAQIQTPDSNSEKTKHHKKKKKSRSRSKHQYEDGGNKSDKYEDEKVKKKGKKKKKKSKFKDVEALLPTVVPPGATTLPAGSDKSALSQITAVLHQVRFNRLSCRTMRSFKNHQILINHILNFLLCFLISCYIYLFCCALGLAGSGFCCWQFQRPFTAYSSTHHPLANC